MTATFRRAETDPVAEADLAALEAALEGELATKLPLAGGTMTGALELAADPAAPLEAATRQYVTGQIAALINGAPSTLDTLNEIAAQLGTDESAVAALTATVAGKLSAAANLGDLANVVTARGNLGTDAAGTARPPTAHKSSHATGGSDVLLPGDLGAEAASAKGQANGYAGLDANAKVAQGRPDFAIAPRELADLARTGGWLPTGAIDETFPRSLCTTQLAMVSGRLWLAGGIMIPGGRTVTSISVPNAAVAGTGLTHVWFCLVDRAGNVLKKTTDDTSTPWAASAVKTLNLSSTYTPTNPIEVYIGVVEVGTTPAPLWRVGGAAGAAIGAGGGLGDSANTGLTDPASLGATISAVPTGQNPFYAFVS